MSSQNSKHPLPHTPRICERIMEYYDLFGQERDLEKFMRIYSPCASSSHGSHRTHSGSNRALGDCCVSRSGESTCATGSHDTLENMNSHHLQLSRVCCGVNSKSMPNIDAQGKAVGGGGVIMDINIDIEGANEKVFSASTECIQTPVKNRLAPAKQVPTPESVAKTHRRLEWDSLGDIGYRKSMSASNLSILERSLLKELFKENSNTSDPASSNLDEIEIIQSYSKDQLKFVDLAKFDRVEHATPPLASSTLVGAMTNKTSTNRGAKPKMISQSTSSTSLQKKFEKYAQTSLRPTLDKHSQEVQVSISSLSSAVNESATPSSFEYRSSRSSKSSKSSEYIEVDISKKQIPTRQHPFITSITELLAAKKHLSQENQHQSQQMAMMRQLHSQFQDVLDENKENQSYTKNSLTSTSSSYSLTRRAPELDLGIQLICSLIEAKSVDGKQKKKLIRNIVKRITKLNDEKTDTGEEESATSESKIRSRSSATSEEKYVYDSVHSSGRNALEKSCQALLDLPCDLGVTTINGGHVRSQGKTNENDYIRKKTSSTYEKLERNIMQDDKSHTNIKPLYRSRSDPSDVLGNQMPTISNKQNSHQQLKTATEHRIDALNLPSEKLSQQRQRNETISDNEEVRATGETISKHKNYLLKTRSTQTSNSYIGAEPKKSDRSTATATTTSSSSSHDLPTQKSLRKFPDTNSAESDQPTMREWLNPLTQSEIEYEEKKRVEYQKSEKAQKNEKTEKQTKLECERTEQLSWIENEINRLECLKHLLLDDNSNEKSISKSSSSAISSKSAENTNESTRTDKLYDSVYSDESSALSGSAKQLINKIDLLLKEPNKDFFDFKESPKKSRERSKKTQKSYEKSKETIQKKDTKIFPNKKAPTTATYPPTQRKKIDTPITSDQSPEVSESLRDLVKQKKRDFMESYKTKKQNHYDALRQQQKEQLFKKYAFLQSSQPTTFKYTRHYSVPHNINRNFSPTEYAYPHSRLPPTPADNLKNKVASDIIYSTTAKANEHRAQGRYSTPTPMAATTSSSTSMFCVSSDVSVPMGSNNVSSTPTTTHHYDDVAAAVAGVAVQTSGSIVHGPQLHPYMHQQRKPTQTIVQPIITTTAAIQVRPKGIAYVIEFESDTNSNRSSNELSANLNTESDNKVGGRIKTSSEPQMSLQDYLEKAKPKFLQQSKERKMILNELQAMRQARDRQLREIIENASFNSLERRLNYLPPPPTQKIRILNTKEMKALTNKRFVSLPEVVARKQREQEERKRMGNRVLRDVFNRRLQRRVRSGKLSLNHSRTVI